MACNGFYDKNINIMRIIKKLKKCLRTKLKALNMDYFRDYCLGYQIMDPEENLAEC